MQVETILIDCRLNENDLKYATPDSAGFDLPACSYKDGDSFEPINDPIAIMPGEKVFVGSGIAIHLGGMLDDYGDTLPESSGGEITLAGMILPRSGLGTKLDIVLANTVGLVDADYQNQIVMCIKNNGVNPFIIEPLDRLAQYVLVPVFRTKFKIVEKFSKTTERGLNGFGSSGVK